MFNNAMVIPWMVSIGADKFLRLSWRHMLLNLILIPFIFYEKRNLDDDKKQLYKWSSILKPQNLKKAYIVSISKALWFVVLTTTFQFTAISHSLILGTLMNFFLSLFRSAEGTVHYLEPGGQIFVVVGILLIFKDEVWMDDTIDVGKYQYIQYMDRPWYLRFGADLIALGSSLFMALSSKYVSDLNRNYTPYLGMLVVNSMITVNMAMFAYFFHGATFDFDEQYGIFSIFASNHFISFLSMSIFLGFGMFWSYAMISNLFPQTLLPSLAALFQPMISLMILDFLEIQQMSSGYTYMGFIFIMPGMFLILVGQYIYQQLKKQQEQVEQQQLKSLIEQRNQKNLSRPISPQQDQIQTLQIQINREKNFQSESLGESSPTSPPLFGRSPKSQQRLSWVKVKKKLDLSDDQENVFGGFDEYDQQLMAKDEEAKAKQKKKLKKAQGHLRSQDSFLLDPSSTEHLKK